MSATLSLQIHSEHSLAEEQIEFFRAEAWTIDTELQLLQQMQVLLSMLRPLGITMHLTLDLTVNDALGAIFIARKKITNSCEISTQKLTIREIEILGLIMQGLTNPEIAEKLFISYETVKSHRKNILEKTGAKNTAALISYYHQTFFEK